MQLRVTEASSIYFPSPCSFSDIKLILRVTGRGFGSENCLCFRNSSSLFLFSHLLESQLLVWHSSRWTRWGLWDFIHYSQCGDTWYQSAAWQSGYEVSMTHLTFCQGFIACQWGMGSEFQQWVSAGSLKAVWCGFFQKKWNCFTFLFQVYRSQIENLPQIKWWESDNYLFLLHSKKERRFVWLETAYDLCWLHPENQITTKLECL